MAALRHFLLTAAAPARPFSRAAWSTVQRDLQAALDGLAYVDDSAEQAYLELDPASRSEGKDAVRARYQAFALQDLRTAVDKYKALQQEEGPGGEAASCEMAAAEAMLARDRLEGELQRNAERQERRRQGRLKTEDLSFCDT